MLGDLGKLIVAKGFKSCPKSKKSPDLVTLERRKKNKENAFPYISEVTFCNADDCIHFTLAIVTPIDTIICCSS